MPVTLEYPLSLKILEERLKQERSKLFEQEQFIAQLELEIERIKQSPVERSGLAALPVPVPRKRGRGRPRKDGSVSPPPLPAVEASKKPHTMTAKGLSGLAAGQKARREKANKRKQAAAHLPEARLNIDALRPPTTEKNAPLPK